MGLLSESLKKYYDTARFKDLDWIFDKSLHFTLGNVNAPTAPNASLFHATTKYLSKTLWLFPLIVVFARRKKVNNRAKYFTPRN